MTLVVSSPRRTSSDPISPDESLFAIALSEALTGFAEHIADVAARTPNPGDIYARIDWWYLNRHLTALALPLAQACQRGIEQDPFTVPGETTQIVKVASTPEDEKPPTPDESLFTYVDQRAVQWSKERSGDLVTSVNNQVKATVKAETVRAVNGKQTVDQTARNLRQSVPVLPRHADATASAADNAYRTAYGAAERRGDPNPQAAAERAAEATRATLTDRYTKYRTKMIARTEIMASQNMGRYAAMHDAKASGVAGPDVVKKWVVTSVGTCDQCAPYSGAEADYNGTFDNGVIVPPLHPHCRCTVILARSKKKPRKSERYADVENWMDAGNPRFTQFRIARSWRRWATLFGAALVASPADDVLVLGLSALTLRFAREYKRRVNMPARDVWSAILSIGTIGEEIGENVVHDITSFVEHEVDDIRHWFVHWDKTPHRDPRNPDYKVPSKVPDEWVTLWRPPVGLAAPTPRQFTVGAVPDLSITHRGAWTAEKEIRAVGVLAEEAADRFMGYAALQADQAMIILDDTAEYARRLDPSKTAKINDWLTGAAIELDEPLEHSERLPREISDGLVELMGGKMLPDHHLRRIEKSESTFRHAWETQEEMVAAANSALWLSARVGTALDDISKGKMTPDAIVTELIGLRRAMLQINEFTVASPHSPIATAGFAAEYNAPTIVLSKQAFDAYDSYRLPKFEDSYSLAVGNVDKAVQAGTLDDVMKALLGDLYGDQWTPYSVPDWAGIVAEPRSGIVDVKDMETLLVMAHRFSDDGAEEYLPVLEDAITSAIAATTSIPPVRYLGRLNEKIMRIFSDWLGDNMHKPHVRRNYDDIVRVGARLRVALDEGRFLDAYGQEVPTFDRLTNGWHLGGLLGDVYANVKQLEADPIVLAHPDDIVADLLDEVDDMAATLDDPSEQDAVRKVGQQIADSIRQGTFIQRQRYLLYDFDRKLGPIRRNERYEELIQQALDREWSIVKNAEGEKGELLAMLDQVERQWHESAGWKPENQPQLDELKQLLSSPGGAPQAIVMLQNILTQVVPHHKTGTKVTRLLQALETAPRGFDQQNPADVALYNEYLRVITGLFDAALEQERRIPQNTVFYRGVQAIYQRDAGNSDVPMITQEYIDTMDIYLDWVDPDHMFWGLGMFGHGLYHGHKEATGWGYATSRGAQNARGHVRSIKLKPDARVITSGRIHFLTKQAKRDGIIPPDTDQSTYAVMLGYDAINKTREGHLNILNRGATVTLDDAVEPPAAINIRPVEWDDDDPPWHSDVRRAGASRMAQLGNAGFGDARQHQQTLGLLDIIKAKDYDGKPAHEQVAALVERFVSDPTSRDGIMLRGMASFDSWRLEEQTRANNKIATEAFQEFRRQYPDASWDTWWSSYRAVFDQYVIVDRRMFDDRRPALFGPKQAAVKPPAEFTPEALARAEEIKNESFSLASDESSGMGRDQIAVLVQDLIDLGYRPVHFMETIDSINYNHSSAPSQLWLRLRPDGSDMTPHFEPPKSDLPALELPPLAHYTPSIPDWVAAWEQAIDEGIAARDAAIDRLRVGIYTDLPRFLSPGTSREQLADEFLANTAKEIDRLTKLRASIADTIRTLAAASGDSPKLTAGLREGVLNMVGKSWPVDSSKTNPLTLADRAEIIATSHGQAPVQIPGAMFDLIPGKQVAYLTAPRVRPSTVLLDKTDYKTSDFWMVRLSDDDMLDVPEAEIMFEELFGVDVADHIGSAAGMPAGVIEPNWLLSMLIENEERFADILDGGTHPDRTAAMRAIYDLPTPETPYVVVRDHEQFKGILRSLRDGPGFQRLIDDLLPGYRQRIVDFTRIAAEKAISRIAIEQASAKRNRLNSLPSAWYLGFGSSPADPDRDAWDRYREFMSGRLIPGQRPTGADEGGTPFWRLVATETEEEAIRDTATSIRNVGPHVTQGLALRVKLHPDARAITADDLQDEWEQSGWATGGLQAYDEELFAAWAGYDAVIGHTGDLRIINQGALLVEALNEVVEDTSRLSQVATDVLARTLSPIELSERFDPGFVAEVDALAAKIADVNARMKALPGFSALQADPWTGPAGATAADRAEYDELVEELSAYRNQVSQHVGDMWRFVPGAKPRIVLEPDGEEWLKAASVLSKRETWTTALSEAFGESIPAAKASKLLSDANTVLSAYIPEALRGSDESAKSLLRQIRAQTPEGAAMRALLRAQTDTRQVIESQRRVYDGSVASVRLHRMLLENPHMTPQEAQDAIDDAFFPAAVPTYYVVPVAGMERGVMETDPVFVLFSTKDGVDQAIRAALVEYESLYGTPAVAKTFDELIDAGFRPMSPSDTSFQRFDVEQPNGFVVWVKAPEVAPPNPALVARLDPDTGVLVDYAPFPTAQAALHLPQQVQDLFVKLPRVPLIYRERLEELRTKVLNLIPGVERRRTRVLPPVGRKQTKDFSPDIKALKGALDGAVSHATGIADVDPDRAFAVALDAIQGAYKGAAGGKKKSLWDDLQIDQPDNWYELKWLSEHFQLANQTVEVRAIRERLRDLAAKRADAFAAPAKATVQFEDKVRPGIDDVLSEAKLAAKRADRFRGIPVKAKVDAKRAEEALDGVSRHFAAMRIEMPTREEALRAWARDNFTPDGADLHSRVPTPIPPGTERPDGTTIALIRVSLAMQRLDATPFLDLFVSHAAIEEALRDLGDAILHRADSMTEGQFHDLAPRWLHLARLARSDGWQDEMYRESLIRNAHAMIDVGSKSDPIWQIVAGHGIVGNSAADGMAADAVAIAMSYFPARMLANLSRAFPAGIGVVAAQRGFCTPVQTPRGARLLIGVSSIREGSVSGAIADLLPEGEDIAVAAHELIHGVQFTLWQAASQGEAVLYGDHLDLTALEGAFLMRRTKAAFDSYALRRIYEDLDEFGSEDDFADLYIGKHTRNEVLPMLMQGLLTPYGPEGSYTGGKRGSSFDLDALRFMLGVLGGY